MSLVTLMLVQVPTTPPFAIDNAPSSHSVSPLGLLRGLVALGFKDGAIPTAANLGDLQRLFHRSADDRQRHGQVGS